MKTDPYYLCKGRINELLPWAALDFTGVTDKMALECTSK